MDNIKSVLLQAGGSVKVVWVFCFILVLTMAFQNCGDLTETTLFSQSSQSTPDSNTDCKSLECFISSDLLWIQIREFEPYVIKLSNIETHFTVGGQCGVGGFPNHRFHWVLRENFGSEQIIGRGSADNLCQTGQFQIPIIANEDTFVVDQRYEVTLELVGIDRNGTAVAGYSPYRIGSLGVLIVPDEKP